MSCCGKRVSKAKDFVQSGASYVRATVGGQSSPELIAQREQLCKSCGQRDPSGRKFFREIDGRFYCGEPRQRKVFRNSAAAGCGCALAHKWSRRLAKCPVGQW